MENLSKYQVKKVDTSTKMANGLSVGESELNEAGIADTSKEDFSKPNVTPLDGYPFAAVETRFGYAIIFGKHMIHSGYFMSIEECYDWLRKNPFNEILNLIGIYIDHVLTDYMKKDELNFPLEIYKLLKNE